LFFACLAATQLLAQTNRLTPEPGVAAVAPDSNDAVEKEYQKILTEDDAAQQEADRIIHDNQQFAAQGAGLSRQELSQRLQAQLAPVREDYESFIRRHPKHARARIAYASFLGDINDEDGAQEQLEQALP